MVVQSVNKISSECSGLILLGKIFSVLNEYIEFPYK